MKPWDGIVSEADIASFSGGFEKISRPFEPSGFFGAPLASYVN